MARLNSPWRETLSQEGFRQYPVWTWDDGNEGYLPMADLEPFWDEFGVCFIKATFKTHGYIFDGYLIGCETFYAFGLFVLEHKFIFNLNMSEFTDICLAGLC